MWEIEKIKFLKERLEPLADYPVRILKTRKIRGEKTRKVKYDI
jgi:hypothetical protein